MKKFSQEQQSLVTKPIQEQLLKSTTSVIKDIESNVSNTKEHIKDVKEDIKDTKDDIDSFIEGITKN